MLLAAAMIAVGVVHFTSPSGFVKIVPAFMPAPLLLVHVSGFFEILGGIGLILQRTHRAAAYGLIALYVAVFPANINMAVNDIQPAGGHIAPALLWARLPLQGALIALVWWLSRAGIRRHGSGASSFGSSEGSSGGGLAAGMDGAGASPGPDGPPCPGA